MADCYYHGYSGGPGVCSQCEAERRAGEEQGTRGLTLEPDLVWDMADKSSLGESLWRKMKTRENVQRKKTKSERKRK